MFRHEKDTSLLLLARLVDATDNETEETAFTISDLTVKVAKADKTYSTVTPTSVDHVGDGFYYIDIPFSAFDVVGQTGIRVSASGANIYPEKIEVYNPVEEAKRVAVQVLTMTAPEVLAHSDASSLPALGDSTYRERLVYAAIENAMPRELDASGNKVVKSLGGTTVYTVTTVSSSPITGLNIATKTS